MDKREALKNMLNNIINDKHEEATLDLHSYLATKMRDTAGLSAEQHQEADEDGDGDDGDDGLEDSAAE